MTDTANSATPGTDATAPATGEHTTNGTPHGYSTLTPFLCVADPEGALGFYTDVLGAHEVNVVRFGDTVVHAELEFGNGRLQLGAAQEDYGLRAADPATDTVTSSLAIYVPDVDAVVARASDAGAVVREPAATWVSGDRFASIRDPFGVRWTVMTRVEDLSDEESERRIAAWAAEQ